MLMPSLSSIAREILRENGWDVPKAQSALMSRVLEDKSLNAELVQRAVEDIIRSVNSAQRMKLQRTAVTAGADDPRGLEVIAREGYLDTYMLLNDTRLGDARKQELNAFISHHASSVRTSTQQIRFARSILASKKFKDNKRIRDCFSEMDLLQIAKECFR